MASVEIHDREIAVILDSLGMARKELNAGGVNRTPTIDSAANKIASLVTPATFKLILSTPEETP